MTTPTPHDKMPRRGSVEEQWWRQGAEDEAYYTYKGMTPDGREFYDFVQVLAQRGDSQWQMTRMVTLVYGATQPRKIRWHLAWALIRGIKK